MSRKLLAFVAVVLMFTQISCLKGSAECDFNPCRYVAPATEVQQVEAYLAANAITATKHCSGMYYRVSSAGSGKEPDGCSYVFVKYTGRTTGGFVFDQQTISPALIDLTRVVTGWRAGIPLIKPGGIISLYIPPYLAYGAQEIKDSNGNVIVPGNSILVFDIELTSVQ